LRRGVATIVLGLVLAAGSSEAAMAAFPFEPGDPADYSSYRLEGTDPRPNDLQGKLEWMYAADKEAGNEPVNSDPRELNGVRGAHLVDRTTPIEDLAWGTTTGRPDVTIAVLDSGIKWNDAGAMNDLRKKVRLTKGELPAPAHDRAAPLEGDKPCADYAAAYDANGDHVFNVLDYACDSRVERDPAQRGGLGVGPADVLDPQDLLIAFTDGVDDDGNGFEDDIAGWDFLDDDNDAFDDVQYGHGTGEERDSTGEAGNGGDLGSCPNCMSIPLRVGDSFIADANRFAQAVAYATDNDVLVVQEALGTLNNSKLARQAVHYAYDHGVTVIASAADEAAQHHNWPSSNPHVIVVNSVTQYDEFTPQPKSYLQFNGCTNFSSKISVAIPSVSCSSDATGRGSGMAGLIYSAALNAREEGKLDAHPDCRRADGGACVVTPNEVRQLMASGTVGGEGQSDDVNFAQQPEPSCTPLATPTCTDPNANVAITRTVFSPLVQTKSYPARKGHDQFYGWGRANLNRAVDAVAAGVLPPEVELESPEWFEQVDPARTTLAVEGAVAARGDAYSCRVYVAPGSYPNNAATTDSPPGDFKPVGGAGWCNGDERSGGHDGTLGTIDLTELKQRFPPTAGGFDGREPGGGEQTASGRPNTEPYGFTIKVVATRDSGGESLTGEDRRNAYLHRDQDLLSGWPRQLVGDGESSPLFVDLDGDNRNELVLAGSDGIVHAFRRDGSELPGWPVTGDTIPLRGAAANALGPVRGAFLGALAAADMNRDGSPEVVGADLEGKVYGWNAAGERVFGQESNTAYSGKPLQPFVDVRFNRANPGESERRRTQHGFVASPVLANIDSDAALEIVAAAMDRHVYAWNWDGSRVPGFPVLVVDEDKVESVDPQSHAVTFNGNAGPALGQGAIVDTPAVGDLTGDGRPEIVVGTNEEYRINEGNEGDYNAGRFNTASFSLLSQTGVTDFAHGRLYAIHADGEGHAGGAFLPGWPVKIGLLQAEILPVVGEGITGAPAIGEVDCPSGGGPTDVAVGASPDAGPGYVLNEDGDSCYGKETGKDIALQSDLAANPRKLDLPAIPAFGHPAFGEFGGGTSFLAPATGLIRALDIAVKEYQGGQDFLGVWDAGTGQFRPNHPAVVNDLQFLTGPSVADVDGKGGEEWVSGTAHLDLHAVKSDGTAVDSGWPKLTSDWMVANPLIGSFGTLDTTADARKSVVALTRSGSVLAYAADAAACSPGSWPRYHHDNANSGDARRDAVSPGRPMAVALSGRALTLTAPGDDLLCGRAAEYEVVTSKAPITGANFGDATPVTVAVEPAPAGERQRIELPKTQRYVAIRAVDEQGNAGPPATVKR
jgi:hypothetical protein